MMGLTLGDGLLDAMFEVWWETTGQHMVGADPSQDHMPAEVRLHKGALHRGFVAGARAIFDATQTSENAVDSH